MILGADNQNKNLRAAAKIKSNPTAKTKTANHYSAAISTSKSGGGSGGSNTVHQSRQKINDGQPDPMKGSYEGLDTGKSAHIQQNGVGYANPSLQTARYGNRNKNIEPASGSSLSFTNMGFKSIMENYSGVTAAGRSSSRLNERTRLNGMF
jgi:hypothetical protein